MSTEARTERDGGGPAFPTPMWEAKISWGMTLRDYFAGQALPELIRLSMEHDGGWSMDTAAQGAYEMADAMIRTRDERGEGS